MTITIEGNNFLKKNLNTTLNTTVVAINRVTRKRYVFVPTAYNLTQVSWKTKSIPAGEYFLFVEVEEVGYSNITIVTVETVITSTNASIST